MNTETGIQRKDRPGYTVASREHERRYNTALAAVIFLFSTAYQLAVTSGYKGSSDLHATIEMAGGLIGILAGFALVSRFYIRYYTMSSRFFLFIGLAFFINGSEDFIHGYLAFSSSRGWTALPASSVAQFIPGTYVTGRLLMATLLCMAPFMDLWMGKSRNPRQEAWIISIVAVFTTITATVFAFNLPLPKFIYPNEFISRPIDFLSAIILCFALVVFLRRFHKDRDVLIWWIALSIAINMVGQGMMSVSKTLYDPFFDIAHVYKLLGYMVPLVGYVFCEIAVVRTISEMAGSITTTATKIAATITQHERTASQQVTAASETSATIEELSASSRQSAEQAANAAAAAEKASTATAQGGDTTHQAVLAMNGLKDKIAAMAEQILHLGEQTGQIGNIATLLKDLSGQINMLALNAAVEAARAGEHGKGFAVVAGEIRKLADQSKKSAEQTATLVTDIQKATNSSIMMTEEGSRTVDEVTQLTQKVAELFNNLSGMAGSVNENAQQVMLNAKQQSAAFSQIIEAANSVAAGAKETAAGISQTKVGVQKLNEAAENLKAIA